MTVEDRWGQRELPVLKAVVGRIDRGQPFVSYAEIARDTELNTLEVLETLLALSRRSPPYINIDGDFDRIVATEQGRQAALQGPYKLLKDESLESPKTPPQIIELPSEPASRPNPYSGKLIYDPLPDKRIVDSPIRDLNSPTKELHLKYEPPPDHSRPSTQEAGAESRPLRLFYSYSHRDERFRQQLKVHLVALRRQGLIEDWNDRDITAGRPWKNDIDANLEAADIILLLVSPDFLASDYAYNKEFKRALERHRVGEVRIVPIILRYSDWQVTPIGELQALPPEGRPVAGRGDRAWLEVAKGLRRVIEEIRKAR